MALMRRGSLFAGALFAGLLFGPGQIEEQQSGGGWDQSDEEALQHYTRLLSDTYRRTNAEEHAVKSDTQVAQVVLPSVSATPQARKYTQTAKIEARTIAPDHAASAIEELDIALVLAMMMEMDDA